MSLDRSYFQNPFSNYLRWLLTKYTYQKRYKDGQLRIGYMTTLDNVVFGKFNFTGKRVHLENVQVGNFSYISDSCIILDTTIGKFCSLAPNILVALGKHPTHTFVSTHPSLYSNPENCLKNFFDCNHYNPKRHVTIGNDVWICANVVISNGVKIGDGAIIGANSVVVRDVEPYTIVGGNPALPIRKRFEQEEIDYLLEIKWWDKSLEWIEQNCQVFLNIKDFIKQKQE